MSPITNVRRSPLVQFAAILLLPLALLLSACPPPVDTLLATAVSDKIAPEIAIASPLIGQAYGATVTVTGTITDDAISAGDGLGTVASIDYTIANDILRRGRITIGADGTVVPDAAFGSGSISWNPASHTFSFVVSTVSPSVLRGMLTVMVNVKDVNGNEKSSILQLSESPGPYLPAPTFDILPDHTTTTYKSGFGVVTFTGLVGNSVDDQGSASDIKSLAWRTAVKAWSGALNLLPGSTDYSGGTYSRANSNFDASMTPTNFTYDPATRQYATSFDVPFNAGSQLPIEVSATDKSGHVTTTTVVLYQDVSGPAISISSPNIAPSVRNYYSSAHYVVPSIVGTIPDYSTVQDVTYRMNYGSPTLPGTTFSLFPTRISGGAIAFGGTGDFSFSLSEAANNLAGIHGDVKVTITAVNTDNNQSQPSFWLYEDSTAPAISGVSISASIAHPLYAKSGDLITLAFSATDGDPLLTSGMLGTPSATIASHPVTVTPGTGNSFSASYTIDGGIDAALSGSVVPFSITAQDVLTNSATVTTGTGSVTFYNGSPTLTPVWITSNNPTAGWAKNGDIVMLHFTSPRVLLATPVVTIANQAATVNTSAAPTYTATHTMTLSDDEAQVPFSINFTDAAGNVGAQVTAITTGSDVVFDKTAPLGYAASIDQTVVNFANRAAMSFTFAGAQTAAGTTCSYTVNSSGGGPTVNGGPIAISTATQQITGINVGGLGDGTLTLSVTLKDAAGNIGGAATATVSKDATAPSGYSVSIDQAVVNFANRAAMSFTFAGADTTAGTTCSYTVNSLGGGPTVNGGPIAISTATQQITGINVGGLGDGTLTLSVTLTDAAGNTGNPAIKTILKDATAPSGYSVNIDQAGVNDTNKAAMSFTFAAAETTAGTTCSYTVNSSGGGPTVNGGPIAISTATQQITGINVIGLGDGTLTLSVTLTDAAGNTGNPAIKTVTKDIVAPSGYTVGIDQAVVTYANRLAMSFTFAGAETTAGTTCSYTVTSSGGGPTVNGGPIAISTATQQITGINVGGLGDGTLTLSVTLTDAVGNVGGSAVATVSKDATAPSGYSVNIDQALIKQSNQTGMSFTFVGADTTAGTTFSYTVNSSGGGTTVTGGPTAVSSATQQVTGINVSGLGDGTLTLSVTLSDAVGNTGGAAIKTVTKHSNPPALSGITLSTSPLNGTASVVFDEPAYGDAVSPIALASGSVTFTNATTLETVAPTGAAQTSGFTDKMHWDFTGLSWGTITTGQIIRVTIIADMIYDAVGNKMPAGLINTPFVLAHRISMFGASSGSAAAAGGASTEAAGSRFYAALPATPGPRDVARSASARAAPAAPAAPAALAAPAPASRATASVREQFHTPLIVAKAPTVVAAETLANPVFFPVPEVAASAGRATSTPHVSVLPVVQQQPVAVLAYSAPGALASRIQEGLPAWWFLGLAALGAALLGSGAWIGIRFVRERVSASATRGRGRG